MRDLKSEIVRDFKVKMKEETMSKFRSDEFERRNGSLKQAGEVKY